MKKYRLTLPKTEKYREDVSIVTVDDDGRVSDIHQETIRTRRLLHQALETVEAYVTGVAGGRLEEVDEGKTP